MRRDYLFWGSALILLGGLLFYQNGVYESAEYASAQNRVEVTIQAGAGKVAVR